MYVNLHTAMHRDAANLPRLELGRHLLQSHPLYTLVRLDILDKPLVHQDDLRLPADLGV